MNIWCYNDTQKSGPGRFGLALYDGARARGHGAVLYSARQPVPGTEALFSSYTFFRLEQWQPGLEESRALACYVNERRWALPIQTKPDILHYERKDLQALAYPDYMPATVKINPSAEDVADIAKELLGYPFLSKSVDGSSCANVRVIRTPEAAQAEQDAAFRGPGILTSKLTPDQKGYLLWQKFLPGNDYIYRVVAVGRYRWMFKEYNRPGTLLASGSGNYEPVIGAVAAGTEEREVLEAANEFFDFAQTKWCAIDMAKDFSTGQWKVLETSLAWGMKAKGSSIDCAVLDHNGQPHPKGYYGKHLWKLLCDEIEEGVFG